MYREDYDGVNCRYRFCPDRVGDPLCKTLTPPTTNTGPNEVWWAPQDSRLPWDDAPNQVDRHGLLYPYMKNDFVFRCPEYGGQVGYAMSYVNGGPMGATDSRIRDSGAAGRLMFVWDHALTPGCADTTNYPSAPQKPPFTPLTGPAAATHYPLRHLGRMNVLFYDGHSASVDPSRLRDSDFRIPGSTPPAAFPLPP